MEFVALGAIALVLLAAGRRPAAPAAPAAPPPTAPADAALDAARGVLAVVSANPGAIAGAAGLSGLGGAGAVFGGAEAVGGTALANTGLVAGAVAYTAAGALAGYRVTGTTAGALIGGANPVAGNAVNAGAQIGRELHKLFGGDGQSATPTGVIAQAAGGTVGLVGSILGGLAAVGTATVGVVVFAVATIAEDVGRLSYGQAGAKRDWEKEFGEVWARMAERLAVKYPHDPEEDRSVYASALAAGWVNEANRQRHRVWMSTARGVGQSEESHRQWGLDRGYWYHVDGWPTGAPIYAGAELLAPAHHPNFVANLQAWTRKHGLDGAKAMSRAAEAGAAMANAANYAFAAAQPRGAGQSFTSHLVHWRRGGYFRGDLSGSDDSAPGTLFWPDAATKWWWDAGRLHSWNPHSHRWEESS